MKYTILLIIFLGFNASYSLYWEDYLQIATEARSLDSLTIFYEEWTNDILPLSSSIIDESQLSVREIYRVYPKIVETLQGKIYGSKRPFWWIQDKVEMEISSNPLDFYEQKAKAMNIALDSVRQLPFRKNEFHRYLDDIIIDSLITFQNDKIKIYGFRPDLATLGIKPLSNLSELATIQRFMLSDNAIEESLSKQGLTTFEINQVYNSSVVYWTKKITERQQRQWFYAKIALI